MTDIEIGTRSNGNIGVMDRAIRIAFGLAVLFGSLYATIDNTAAYPLLKSIAAIVVLTGIAGWDPLYALFRSLRQRMIPDSTVTKSSLNPS